MYCQKIGHIEYFEVRDLEYFTIQSDKPEFKLFNGLLAKPVRTRSDGYIEVYVPAIKGMILLESDELIDN